MAISYNHRMVLVGRDAKDTIFFFYLSCHGSQCHPLYEIAQGPVQPGPFPGMRQNSLKVSHRTTFLEFFFPLHKFFLRWIPVEKQLPPKPGQEKIWRHALVPLYSALSLLLQWCSALANSWARKKAMWWDWGKSSWCKQYLSSSALYFESHRQLSGGTKELFIACGLLWNARCLICITVQLIQILHIFCITNLNRFKLPLLSKDLLKLWNPKISTHRFLLRELS